MQPDNTPYQPQNNIVIGGPGPSGQKSFFARLKHILWPAGASSRRRAVTVLIICILVFSCIAGAAALVAKLTSDTGKPDTTTGEDNPMAGTRQPGGEGHAQAPDPVATDTTTGNDTSTSTTTPGSSGSRRPSNTSNTILPGVNQPPGDDSDDPNPDPTPDPDPDPNPDPDPDPDPDPPAWGLDFDPNPTYQLSSITLLGDLTYTFDQNYTVGQYANGDWWVVGPVTLTGITPDSTSTSNGANINPGRNENRYDDELGTPVHQLSFPLTVQPGSSVVKTMSRPDGYGPSAHRGVLKSAGVLTVVDSPPPKNGAISFRPPYYGNNKPQYLTTDLRTDFLPNLPKPSSSTASLAALATKMAPVQLDHDTGNEHNRELHPVDNLWDYGSDYAQNTTYLLGIRLLFDDSLSEKSQALINFVQYGIDLNTMLADDATICSSSNPSCAGHGQGRALPLVFAAAMLDSQDLKDVINNKQNRIPDNWSTYMGSAPTPLFGETTCSIPIYLGKLASVSNPGSRTCRDPWAQIDGSGPFGSYINCCMSQLWKASVTALHLMPELKDSWPQHDKLITFMDRWTDFGYWTRPDTESGQRPDLDAYHGTNADQGDRRVEAVDELWQTYNLSDKVTTDWANL